MTDKLKRDDLLRLTGTDPVNEMDLPQNLMNIILDKSKRVPFFNELMHLTVAGDEDLFMGYFQDNLAKRGKYSQDFTPNAAAKLMSRILGDRMASHGITLYEPTAGTGALLMPAWWNNLITLHPNPFAYSPHEDYYVASEIDKDAIPFLLTNLAIRGINATVIEGDTLNQTVVNVYHLLNVEDEFLAYSDINVLDRSSAVLENLGLKSYTGDARKVSLETSDADLEQWVKNVNRNTEAQPVIEKLFSLIKFKSDKLALD